MVKKTPKSFADVMPKIEFYPELPKVKLDEVLDKPFELTGAKIVRDFDSKFGKSDFALLLMTGIDPAGPVTTLCGGMVVVKKVQYALDNELLPLMATITYDQEYYDIN